MTVPDGTPEVAGEGVLLTAWRDSDVGEVLAWAADPQTHQWSSSMRTLRTPELARVWMARGHGSHRVDWAVRDLPSGDLVGRVSLYDLHGWRGNAEIGYGVVPRFRGHGVARRAVTAAARHGFAALGLHRISLIHAVANGVSCAVAARSGFAFEGVERSALDHGDGVRYDVHRHSRLATDPPGPVRPAPRPIQPLTLGPVRAQDGGQLLLRPLRDADAPAVLAALGDPSIARWSEWPPPRNDGEAAAWIAARDGQLRAGSSISWAMTDAVTDQLLGWIGLGRLDGDDGQAVASCWVTADSRGRGVATAALKAATAHAFARLDVHRVQLQHALDNPSSCRVASRAGFALEGTARGSGKLSDGWVDEHVHARLAGDS